MLLDDRHRCRTVSQHRAEGGHGCTEYLLLITEITRQDGQTIWTGRVDQAVTTDEYVYRDYVLAPIIPVLHESRLELRGWNRTAIRSICRGWYQSYCRQYDDFAISAQVVPLVTHPVCEALSADDERYQEAATAGVAE